MLRFLNKWIRRKEGTTAVEFSFLAIPFMFTAMGIIELSLYFASSVVMEGAVQDTGRLIRTGQLQQMGSSASALTEFTNTLCNKTRMLMDCAQFQYQVKQLDDFNDDTSSGLDEDGNMPTSFAIDEVTSGCVALVRVSYPYQFITPLFGSLWSSYPGNKRLLMSTLVFEVEPYNFTSSC